MQDTNVNLAQCIVTKTHFGYDTIVNVCKGGSVNIDWAFGDWALLGFLVAIGLLFVIVLAGLARMMLTDSF